MWQDKRLRRSIEKKPYHLTHGPSTTRLCPTIHKFNRRRTTLLSNSKCCGRKIEMKYFMHILLHFFRFNVLFNIYGDVRMVIFLITLFLGKRKPSLRENRYSVPILWPVTDNCHSRLSWRGKISPWKNGRIEHTSPQIPGERAILNCMLSE